MMIGATVIFMVRGRFKYRIQIECTDAEFLQVVEFFDDALQIAPVAAPLDVIPDVPAVFVLPGLHFVPVGCPGRGAQR